MEIAILSGGDSSEYIVSVRSAEEISNWLKAAGYSTHLVEIKGSEWLVRMDNKSYPVDMGTFSFKKGKTTIKFDYAWNIIHGSPGENGQIQGYLDMLGIPYSCSGHFASALTFHKYATKNYLKQFGIMTAEAELLIKGKEYNIEEITEKVGLPCFVKPNSGGSSFGTTKVNHIEDMQAAINAAFKEDEIVIIESFVKGTEITCGLLKTSEEDYIFPLTEIVPSKEFFDYNAKYKGEADEITPARMDSELAKKCQKLSSEIYDLTFCKGLVRVDYIMKGNQLYFLEINTIPGMSKESIIPQQINAAGMKVESILVKVIKDTYKK